MEAVLGREHQLLGVVLNDLALVYTQQGRYADAASVLRRSIEIASRLGENHPERLRRLESYAAVLRLMHDKKQAARIEAQVRRGLALTGDPRPVAATVSIDSLRRGR
jgi:lipopolysaccharide biosynthesis regulator YciM